MRGLSLGSTCPRQENVSELPFFCFSSMWLATWYFGCTHKERLCLSLQAYLLMCDLNFNVWKRTVTLILALGPEKFAFWVVNCEELAQRNQMVNCFLLSYWIFGPANQSYLWRGRGASEMSDPWQSPSLSLRSDMSHCHPGAINHSLLYLNNPWQVVHTEFHKYQLSCIARNIQTSVAWSLILNANILLPLVSSHCFIFNDLLSLLHMAEPKSHTGKRKKSYGER